MIALNNENIKIDIINNILEKGVDINKQNHDGYTAILIALYKSTDNIINRILEMKPDVNIISDMGHSVLGAALKYKKPDIINKILNLRPEINKDWVIALRDESGYITLEIILRILDLKPTMNVIDENGNIPFNIALKYQTSREIIERVFYMTPPKDFEKENEDGYTPFMIALLNKEEEIIKKMIYHEKYSDINKRGKDGSRPILLALEFCELDIINKILDLNPDINIKNEYGDTPLTLAKKYSTEEVIKRIEKLTNDIYEEDSDPFNFIRSDGSSLPEEIKTESCYNNNVYTLEPYTEEDEPIMIYSLNSKNKYTRAGCMTIDEYTGYIMSDLETTVPTNIMTIFSRPRDYNMTGLGGKATGKLIVKLPFDNMYVTFGSAERIVREYETNKIWYALPLYGGKRRRVGNIAGIFGSSMNHGQIPGFVIYKLFRKDEIMKNMKVVETNDYPIYIYNNMRPLLDIIGEDKLSNMFITNIIKNLV
jgi:ankyrin repeat protein